MTVPPQEKEETQCHCSIQNRSPAVCDTNETLLAATNSPNNTNTNNRNIRHHQIQNTKGRICKLGEKELHIAPMLDVSTIDFRHFIRLFTKRATLWTEMVVAETLVYVEPHQYDDHLAFDDEDYYYDDAKEKRISQHPIICQIGGNSPHEASFAAKLILEKYKYDGIDLNAECPSNRVATKREFGAALMTRDDGDLAVNILQSMMTSSNDDDDDDNTTCTEKEEQEGNESNLQQKKNESLSLSDKLQQPIVSPPSTTTTTASKPPNQKKVSIKTRIGIDQHESLPFLLNYISNLHTNSNVTRFFIHARKVYTSGLNPAQNRFVPPLNYTRVYELCNTFPQCNFWLNGGIWDLKHARDIAFGDGVKFDCDGIGYIQDNNDPIEEKEDNKKYLKNHGDNSSYYPKDKHGSIPCKTCQVTHGSCITPPSPIAPHNLKGVMIGRMAKDDPSSLAKVDTYFYGESSNPSLCRRDVLEQYARYLEKVYPQRCYDDDDMITIGRRKGDWKRKYNDYRRRSCHVCQDIYGPTTNAPSDETNSDDEDEEKKEGENGDNNGAITSNHSKNTSQLPSQQQTQSLKRYRRHILKNKSSSSSQQPKKIVSRVIDQALKPTLGILYNQKGNSKFKRTLHELSRDGNIRNCGPGYILRKAMMCVEDDIWDKPF
mmetsp:Transcript_33997/g.50759  ORF Transcript_33997/g.50759 Transcript_33997/m.50759 type:complete len:658 (-) Transcript_33997:19-1992(-)